jgi:hypothetical protein
MHYTMLMSMFDRFKQRMDDLHDEFLLTQPDSLS